MLRLSKPAGVARSQRTTRGYQTNAPTTGEDQRITALKCGYVRRPILAQARNCSSSEIPTSFKNVTNGVSDRRSQPQIAAWVANIKAPEMQLLSIPYATRLMPMSISARAMRQHHRPPPQDLPKIKRNSIRSSCSRFAKLTKKIYWPSFTRHSRPMMNRDRAR